MRKEEKVFDRIIFILNIFHLKAKYKPTPTQAANMRAIRSIQNSFL